MHDKYLIYFELEAFLIWFAQQKVVRLQLHDLKVHNMHFREKLEIWGKAQRESARRPKSDWGKLGGSKKGG